MDSIFLAEAPFFYLHKFPDFDYDQWTVKKLFREGKKFDPMEGETLCQFYMDIFDLIREK